MIALPKGPYCIIQKQDDEYLLLLKGNLRKLDELSQITRHKENLTEELIYSSVSVVPFSQAKEKGYKVKDSGEKILSIEVEEYSEIKATDFINSFESFNIVIKDGITSNYTEEEYKDVVSSIIDDEIKNGEGCNFVIPRKFEGKIDEFSQDKALSIFKSLLQEDYGTYWKFIFYTGDRYFIGSTPERHLEINKTKVKMNPISGTFRKNKVYDRRKDFKNDLVNFLQDEKEVNELFMVLDEELKMMTKMCSTGGSIAGPLLKEMSRLIHTEYLLVGESKKDIFELLRESMFAATVTGSPIKNAFDIINKYEPSSRGYYGSAIVLNGVDETGLEFLDSPILIRTLDISSSGEMSTQVGATLVRNSVPAEELLETEFKISAIFNTFANNRSLTQNKLMPLLINDDDIHYTLNDRNQNLSNFWFRSQYRTHINSVLSSKQAVLINNDDDFIFMLDHMLVQLGLRTTVVSYDSFNLQDYVVEADIFIVGPGPGNPNDIDNKKIAKNLVIIDQLYEHNCKILGICLGHQILSKRMNLEVSRKQTPSQGVQKKVRLFELDEIVGFYNTFVPIKNRDVDGVEFALEDDSLEVLAMRAEGWASFQFHPESILTKNGISILEQFIKNLIA